jgi:hypothetical protein
MVHHDQVVAQRDGLGAVVRDQERGNAELREKLPQFAPQPLPGGGVERGQRFIEQEQPGAADQGPGQGHALLLATG